MHEKAVIIMGSEKDLEFCRKLMKHLGVFKLDSELRAASAHKTPEKVLEILREYEKEKIVYIAVAGRSNALGAFIDANTTKPVISCPPYSEKFGGTDIFSSLRVPSGVGSLVTIEPEGAAIATAKMLAIDNQELAERIRGYQQSKRKEIEKADSAIRKLK